MNKAMVALGALLITTTGHAATNRVLALDGSSDYVIIPSSSSLNLTNFTIECWVYPTTTASDAGIVVKGRDIFENYSLDLVSGLLGSPSRFVDNSRIGVGEVATNRYAFSAHQWQHVAVTYNGTTGKLFVNGYLWSESSYSNVPDFSNEELTIGAERLSGDTITRFFSGYIDEVRVWNRAVDDYTLSKSIHTRLNGTESGLVGYWTFDDGTANDSSSNANNGTLIGDATTTPDVHATNTIYLAIEVPFQSGSPMTRYQLQYITNMLSTNWFDAGLPIRGSGSEQSLFDAPRGESPRFYRIISDY